MTDRTLDEIIEHSAEPGYVALDALTDAGYVIVPREATREALKAAHKCWYHGTDENWMGGHTSPDSVAPHFAKLYSVMIGLGEKPHDANETKNST